MRVTVKELMEKLAVDRVLHPYETQPWYHYDEEKGITCSAEVRMGPGGDDVEAEIQFLHDEKEDGENDEGNTGTDGGPQQIMRLQALPASDDKWAVRQLFVKGEDYKEKIGNWHEKGCSFFYACVSAMNMGELPDIDALIEKELKEDPVGGGKRGRIGRKSPKANTNALLGMKKGM